MLVNKQLANFLLLRYAMANLTQDCNVLTGNIYNSGGDPGYDNCMHGLVDGIMTV